VQRIARDVTNNMKQRAESKQKNWY